MRVAVVGLGEAGSIYAADLPARGASVIGTDLHVAPASVSLAADIPAAVRGADIVLSLVGASSAASVLDEALPAMSAASVFADMNTSGPDDKRRLAAVAADAEQVLITAAVPEDVPPELDARRYGVEARQGSDSGAAGRISTITELSTSALRELFALEAGAVGE